MAALITALDTFTPTQNGENCHREYGWSNNIREKIVQFSFQLTRTSVEKMDSLKITLYSILLELNSKITSSNPCERLVGRAYLSIMFMMIGQTRDIIDGKGEYALSYMMIHCWYSFFPELAFYAIKCLVDFGDDGKTHQYGCWKDIKYFCEYCKTQGDTLEHPLVMYCVKLINEQLKKDHLSSEKSISLVARWTPREKSKFQWIYSVLACDYFSNYIETAKTDKSMKMAILKCMTEYRKLLAELNKKLDTLQIKQCGKTWSTIDFTKVTSISLTKQKKAFLNIKVDNSQRSEEADRIECADNFRCHIQKAIRGEVEMKGKRVGMEMFSKQALELMVTKYCNENYQAQIDLLNSQWRDNSSLTGSLSKIIAMVDVSGSMEGDPMHAAIALGIRVAEKSALGKRVMTFSSAPRWCNLENHSDFCSMVETVKDAPWGGNTNIYAALEMILDAIIEAKLNPEEVEGMILAIFSDMQIDDADNGMTLFDTIEEKYSNVGIRLHGKPFKPPHILFWNLRSTNGFPSLSTQTNVSMMSGFNGALLNLFCEKGMDAFESCTPWSVLLQSLENPRYKMMSDKIEEVFSE